MITLQFHNQVLYHLTQFTSAVNPKSSQFVIKNKRNKSTINNADNLSDKNLIEGNKNCTEFITCGININNYLMKKTDSWIALEPIVIKCLCKIQKNNKWKTSYVPHWSFSRNKQKFPCSALTEPIILPAIFVLTKQQCRMFYNYSGKSSLIHSTHARHFKTAQNIKVESERNPSIISRIKQWFKEMSATSATKASILSETKEADVEKLKNLFNNPDVTASERNKVITAFVEGYEAGLHRKVKRPLVFKFLQFFIFGFSVLLILYLVNSPSSVFKITFPSKSEIDPEEVHASFEDIKGVDSAKAELKEIVEFLKYPEKFTSLGAKLPKGVLLVGPPGTGKTLLARAVAGEAGVPFFHSAGPEFDEVLVGQGARRVRELFKSAKEKAPCVIFIDEIDSVGSMRTNSYLHPYANQTVNQLLTEMDGFHQNEGVIVLGATNRHGDLDKAILRPGRFDVHVFVDAPDYSGRKEIFELYLSRVISRDVDIDVLARLSLGFTGADIENMVNQAALRAAIDGAECVTMKHLEWASDKVKMGPEKKKLSDEESRRITAYHEGGHTLVAYFTKLSHLVHKATIIPRGQSGGHTSFLLKKENIAEFTKSELLATLDVMMGGRAAEEIIFGADKITAGASSDFQNATSIAENMVKHWGMSDKLGFRIYKDSDSFKNEYSPHFRELIDQEIKRLLQESYERAKTLLKTHSKELKLLADALLKYETLDSEEIKTILSGKKIRNDSVNEQANVTTNVL